MAVEIINKEKHKNHIFKGCTDCEANCCVKFSRIEITLYDYAVACARFPVFFVVDKDNNPRSRFMMLFSFYDGMSCAYLGEDKFCTIYNERPLTCRTYPISWPQKSNIENEYLFSFDNSCPGCVYAEDNDNNYIKFVENDTLSPKFIEKFVDYKVLNNHNLIMEKTKEFISFCHENGLLSTLEKIRLNNKKELNLKGSNIKDLNTFFRIVDPQKYNNLSEEKKAEAVQKGYIHYINLHLKSLENINKLYERAEQLGKVKKELIIV